MTKQELVEKAEAALQKALNDMPKADIAWEKAKARVLKAENDLQEAEALPDDGGGTMKAAEKCECNPPTRG